MAGAESTLHADQGRLVHSVMCTPSKWVLAFEWSSPGPDKASTIQPVSLKWSAKGVRKSSSIRGMVVTKRSLGLSALEWGHVMLTSSRRPSERP